MEALRGKDVVLKTSDTLRKHLGFLAIVLVALLPRAWLLSKSLALGLSVDELQSATHATLPLPSLLSSVALFDPHPPLFFIQLHYWIRLASSTSDLWLMVNPLLWSLATAISLYFIGNRLFGPQIGVIAALLFSVSAISIAYSNIVRMYSMLMFLALWHFYFSHLYFDTHAKLVYGVGAFLTGLGFIYSHGAGFLILASNASLAALHYWNRKKSGRSSLARRAILPAALLVGSAPWFVRASTVSVSHTQAPTLLDVQHTFSQLLLGSKIVLLESNALLTFSSLMMLGLVSALTINYNSRALAFSFLVVPIFASHLVSYLIRPIWVTWTLVYIIPLFCLGIAIWVGELMSSPQLRAQPFVQVQLLLFGLLVFGLVFGMFYQQTNYLPWSHLKRASTYLTENADPSEIVIVPNEQVFWGWAWYFNEPGSVNPLTTSYQVISQDGVKAISNPAISQGQVFKATQTLWVVYRPGESVNWSSNMPAIVGRERVREFRNVVIDKWVIDH